MKLVAIDMDGTLLHSDRHISTYTTEVIHALQKDHYFVVATGRSLTDARDIVHEAGITADGYVCANGAIVADKHGHVLKEERLDRETAVQVGTWLNDQKFYYHLSTSNGHYASKDSYQYFLNELEDYANSHDDTDKVKEAIRTQADRQIKKMGLHTLRHPSDILNEDFTPYKFLVLSLFPERLESIRNKWELDEDLLFTSSGTDNVEIMPAGVEKGNGLELISKHLNVNIVDTFAIGDNYNDLSMFNTSGFSISMGNADDYIKSQTDATTDTHDQDGVAKAIQKHVLSE
ncbi:Cof-type HAD-IIB family hydrolase [Geomicrobium sp. JCM 19039]|uniref:Cof-type HAD-IIB family hydrolase n=1 Tax=Geomicrobium sp. JCM 19039 TaxID=1460636 RepID=UPI00045F2C75|nr:Cof-type HAD-IIB family hydrolase [Geomicrobium sp. JCM 19039]GAK10686.1 hydrolase [Geomicrobium sp. JCM 19039]